MCAPSGATLGTPAITIFKLPKLLQARLQQLVKISPQSGELCVLLVEQHRILELVQFFNFYFRATLGVKEVAYCNRQKILLRYFYEYRFYITLTS